MKKIYVGGTCRMEIEDDDGNVFIFKNIKLTQKQIKDILKTMSFHGCKVKEIEKTDRSALAKWV